MSVTYLYGAGASFHSLPVVAGIPQAYSEFQGTVINLLRERGITLVFPMKYEKDHELYWAGRFLTLLDKFEHGINNHASIDTYAKKLYLTDRKKLPEYKFCLSAFLSYSQIIKGPDQRYDTFYASIFQDDIFTFPEGLRIISWNYDTQFEIAYSNYSGSDSMEEAKENLHIISKQDLNSLNNVPNDFHIVKLNGTIGFIDHSSDNAYYLQEKCFKEKKVFDQDDLSALIKTYENMATGKDTKPSMSFAWEEFQNGDNPIIETASVSIVDTDTLVVIGYSFPYFNRQVDRKLFSSMPALEKVYIQDPGAHSLIEKVTELCDYEPRSNHVEIVPVLNVDSFLIPNELN